MKALLLLLALLVLVSACGDGGGNTSTGPQPGTNAPPTTFSRGERRGSSECSTERFIVRLARWSVGIGSTHHGDTEARNGKLKVNNEKVKKSK